MRSPNFSLSARTLAATTALAFTFASSAIAQDTCDVVAHLDEAVEALASWGIDYSGAGGDFIGDSTAPYWGGSWGTEPLVCSSLLAVSEFTALDDNAGVMTHFIYDADLGLLGPGPAVSCVFALSSGFPCPAPAAFSIVDQAFPDDPFPPPIVFPPPPAMHLTVSARTPVCGDGFIEGTEECDDGNTSNGDCCSATCTQDAESTPCDDGSVCTAPGTCDAAGVCQLGATLDCDDGVMCTRDYCDDVLGCQSADEPSHIGSHQYRCEHARRVKVDLRDNETDATKDRLKVATKLIAADIGDPTADADYAVCLYDGVGGAYAKVMQIDIPAGSPWALRGGSGSFGYIDKTGANHGVEKIRLKMNKKGKGKFLLIGNGTSLPLPGAFDIGSYMELDPEASLQIENSNGDCWDTHLGNTPLKNDADRFKVKY